MNKKDLLNMDEAAISYKRKLLFTFFSLFILLCLIYSNSFDCSWHFDDHGNILENKSARLNQLNWTNLKKIFFSIQNNPKKLYRPVSCFSFALNYYFHGYKVFGYHLVNFIIHFTASYFLFLFIYHTLNLQVISQEYTTHSYFIALIATIFWAVNPIQVQAITYIVQRMASLAGMFFIICLYFYLKYKTANKKSMSYFYLVICLFSVLMAFSSKENTILLPIVLLLYDLFFFQNDFNFRNFLINKKLLIVFAFVLIIIFSSILLLGSLENLQKAYEQRPFSLSQRIFTEFNILLFYISLIIYPLTDRLNLAHYIRLSNSIFDSTVIFSILAISSLIGLAFFLRRKNPIIGFSILFFFVNHIVESTILPLELIFEHRNYIPSMLFFLPIIIGFYKILKLYSNKYLTIIIIHVFIGGIIFFFSHASYLRNMDWKNEINLWLTAVKNAPDVSRSHHNLAKAYFEKGFKEKALKESYEALRTMEIANKNEKYLTYYNMGTIYMATKEYEKAIDAFNKAIEIDPYFAGSYNNLASIYNQRENDKLTYDYLVKAYKESPENAEININLALYYLKIEKSVKAITHLNNINMVELSEDLKMRTNYLTGIAYKQNKKLNMAIRYLIKAMELSPNDPLVDLHIADIYLSIAKKAIAEKYIKSFYQKSDKILKTKETINSFLTFDIKNHYVNNPNQLKRYLNSIYQMRDKEIKDILKNN